MRRVNKDRQRDEQILMAMHLVENRGYTMREAGEVLGMTKNAVIGALGRVRTESTGIYCHARKPENQNGGMPDLWWFDPHSDFGESVINAISLAQSRKNA